LKLASAESDSNGDYLLSALFKGEYGLETGGQGEKARKSAGKPAATGRRG